jgi:hypothetical protein
MKSWICFAVVALLIPGALWPDHQRVAQVARTDHRWEASLGFSLTPWSASAWDLSLSPRLTYGYQRTWEASAGTCWDWSARAGAPAVESAPGPWSVSLGWTPETSDIRWRVGTGLSAPWPGGGQIPVPSRVRADLGLSVVRDPAILAASVGWSAPVRPLLDPGIPPSWTLSGNLSFQEVVNDNVVWSLALCPTLAWEGSGTEAERLPAPALALSLSWGLGWYQEPHSLSVDASTSTGQTWTLSASGSRSW